MFPANRVNLFHEILHRFRSLESLTMISESLQWNYKPPGGISESLQWNYKPPGGISESL